MHSGMLNIAVAEPPSMRFSAAERTFVIRPHGPIWQVADDRGNVGGIFATLGAALKFARWESAHVGSARVVIVG
jgi:hypothetical protein